MPYRITPSIFPTGSSKTPLAPGNARVVARDPGWPVIFYDTQSIISGGGQSFRSEAFTNNLKRPVDLHTLRVQIQTASGAAAGILGGGVAALEMLIDGVKVTRSAVPVWSLCRSDNRMSENFGGGLTEYAWYFSHPVPVGVGKKITISARHLGIITQNITVNLALVGALGEGAIPKRVPYAAYWESKSFAYAEVGSDSAPPAAIVNDTLRDLHVSRIIGRSMAFDDASGAGNEFTDLGDVSTQGVSSFTLRLGLSQQRPILKTYTQWRAVFGHNAAFETDFLMAPGDYLTADVKHAAGPALNTPFGFSQNKASVSIVGWREV